MKSYMQYTIYRWLIPSLAIFPLAVFALTNEFGFLVWIVICINIFCIENRARKYAMKTIGIQILRQKYKKDFFTDNRDVLSFYVSKVSSLFFLFSAIVLWSCFWRNTDKMFPLLNSAIAGLILSLMMFGIYSFISWKRYTEYHYRKNGETKQ